MRKTAWKLLQNFIHCAFALNCEYYGTGLLSPQEISNARNHEERLLLSAPSSPRSNYFVYPEMAGGHKKRKPFFFIF